MSGLIGLISERGLTDCQKGLNEKAQSQTNALAFSEKPDKIKKDYQNLL